MVVKRALVLSLLVLSVLVVNMATMVSSSDGGGSSGVYSVCRWRVWMDFMTFIWMEGRKAKSTSQRPPPLIRVVSHLPGSPTTV